MFFAFLTLITALLIEGLGTMVSVIGLSTLFGANPLIIAIAISLDLGKIVVVNLLYGHWKRLAVGMRMYAVIAAIVTMSITSAGAAGYLTGEFQKAITGTKDIDLVVQNLQTQQQKYEVRKRQIDDQIAALPDKTTVAQRLRIITSFKAEQTDIQAKIDKIEAELPALQSKQIGVQAKAGPIITIARSFDIPVESAIKWVVLLIVFVFDPLAIFLLLAANSLFEQVRAPPVSRVEDSPVKIGSVPNDPKQAQELLPIGIEQPVAAPQELREHERSEATVEPALELVPLEVITEPIQEVVANPELIPEAVAPVEVVIAEAPVPEVIPEVIPEVASPAEVFELYFDESISVATSENADAKMTQGTEVVPEVVPEVVQAPAEPKRPARETITLATLGLRQR